MIEAAGSSIKQSCSDYRYVCKATCSDFIHRPHVADNATLFGMAKSKITRSAVTRWFKEALAYARISQSELARQLEEKAVGAFDRSMVNKIALGKRDLSAQEMLEVATITGFPPPSVTTNLTQVPLLDSVAAGKLKSPSSQIPVDQVPLLAFADLGSGDFFALRIDGDSVDRISPDGSVVVVDRMDRQLIAGKFFIFAYKGETTCKMWQPDPPHLAPFSTNPANKPIFIKRKSEFEVIGRVKRSMIDL